MVHVWLQWVPLEAATLLRQRVVFTIVKLEVYFGTSLLAVMIAAVLAIRPSVQGGSNGLAGELLAALPSIVSITLLVLVAAVTVSRRPQYALIYAVATNGFVGVAESKLSKSVDVNFRTGSWSGGHKKTFQLVAKYLERCVEFYRYEMTADQFSELVGTSSRLAHLLRRMSGDQTVANSYGEIRLALDAAVAIVASGDPLGVCRRIPSLVPLGDGDFTERASRFARVFARIEASTQRVLPIGKAGLVAAGFVLLVSTGGLEKLAEVLIATFAK